MSATRELTAIAEMIGLDPVEAIALPSAVSVAASKVGMTDAAMIAELQRNAALRDYLGGICREVDVIGALA